MPEPTIFERMQCLIGEPALARLTDTRVAVFGVGGVGSWAAEALIRSGVGHLTLIDNDVVCLTNVNRQAQATSLNVGCLKVDELKSRLVTLNPQADISTRATFYDATTADDFDLAGYDYVLDCIDSTASKVALVQHAVAAGTTLYSSMGAARKLDPTLIKIASIWETTGCPLARVIRHELRTVGFEGDFQTIYSTEAAFSGEQRKGSAVHMTATFGMFLASLVINDKA